MLTDRTATALPRARTRAPQLTRLAWLAMVLLGLLFAHGLHGESAAGHLTAGLTAPLPVHDVEPPADLDQHQHEDDASQDSAHNCAPHQPNDTLPVPAPDTSSSVDHRDLSAHSGTRAVFADPDAGPPAAPTVLRI